MGIKGKNDRMVVLACEDCKERNYTTVKNKKNTKERLELSKYCPTCRKHTNHKETKQCERAEGDVFVASACESKTSKQRPDPSIASEQDSREYLSRLNVLSSVVQQAVGLALVHNKFYQLNKGLIS